MRNQSSRRKVVERAVESFKNAEGNIPLNYKAKDGFIFAPVSEVHEYEHSRRNGLPVLRFDLINPKNGHTLGVLAQCANLEAVKKAYAALEVGGKPVVTALNGNRTFKPDYRKGGITVIAADSITIEYPQINAEAVSAELLSAPQPEDIFADATHQ